jgi:hypothetical protein
MNQIHSLQANQVARKGRFGDTDILHVNKAEIAGLDALARSVYGHGMTTNPETGKKEAFLFLPMLAPLLASSGMLGAGLAGLGALGTGALAAGAGTLEAAARGMDDPLKQGLMAGITAGAGSALTSGIMDAGAQAATQGMTDAGAQAATQVQVSPQIRALMAQDQAVLGAAQPGLSQGTLDAWNASSLAPTITNPMAPAPITSAGSSAPYAVRPVEPTFLDTAGSKLDQFSGGLNRLATNDKALETYLTSPATKAGAIGTAVGLGGQAQLDYEAKMRGEAEGREADRQAEYNRVKNMIKQNYAGAGREGWWNRPGALNPGFADGGFIPQTVGYTATDRAQQSSFTPFVSTAPVQFAKGGQVFPMQSGGFVIPKYAVDAVGNGNNERGLEALARRTGAKPIRGKGTGTSDSIRASVDGVKPARVSNGEAYVPPKKVAKAGGSKQFYALLDAAKRRRA